ncbi:MAG: phosphatase PAP2 family protein [Actinomycetota bacterium]
MPRRDAITALVLSVLTATLLILVADHTTRAHIQRIDLSFLRQMISSRSGPLTAIAKVLNLLGLVYVTLPVRIVIAAFLGLRRRWWHFAAFATSMILAEISIGFLKGLYDRARPPGSLVSTSGASFPSGHAVAAAVTVVAAVIALFPEGGRRYGWGVVAAVFSLVMGLSRAYLGAHWLSDAVAGVLLGTSVALCVAVGVHLIRERGLHDGNPEPVPVRDEQLAASAES